MNPQLQSVVDFVKTERMQVILILLFVILSIFFTVQFVVLEQLNTAQELRNERDGLNASQYASQSSANLLAIVEQERANLNTISNEWSRIAKRLATLHPPKFTDTIDYKVQLYNVRDSLQKKSEQLKIKLIPTEFMDDALSSDEDTQMRMLQLSAVEYLADLTLDRQIQQLVELYPLPPIEHVDAKGNKTFSEYPVRVECDVDFTHLYSFFQVVFEENKVFTFRNFRIESGPTFDSKLRVKAIMSALLFD
ncbi:MAG: hypothetical protein FWH21_05075 [Kiritimatiellaeota bacterium]|nr:hypothetical protein [Kiritimatiellota bacterium]